MLCHNNRRQGISVVSVDGLRLRGRLTDTNGTNPQSGIDFEPNQPSERLKNIEVDVFTSGNHGAGLIVALVNLDETSEPVSMEIRHTSELDGLIAATSGGPGAHFIRTGSPGTNGKVGRPTGHIYYKGDIRRPGLTGILFNNWDKDSVKVTVDNPVIVDPNELSPGPTFARAGISIYNQAGASAADILGGVTIRNPIIRDTRERLTNYIFIQNTVSQGDCADNFIIDPIEMSGIDPASNRFEGNGRFTDRLGTMKGARAGSATIGAANFVPHITNEGATDTIVLTMGNIGVGPEITFERVENQNMIIRPGAGAQIYPGTTGENKGVQLGSVGSRITLRRESASKFVIVSAVGPYSFES